MSKLTIGLDLSTSCSGYAVFYDAELIMHGRIKPKTTLDVIERIEYMTRQFEELFISLKKDFKDEEVICVIENIYLAFFKGKNQVTGFGNLGRVSGAVMATIFLVLKKNANDIKLINANVARPIVGLKGSCQKAEVQCWVLEKFFNKDVYDYQALIDAVFAKKGVGDIDQKEFKKRMDKISKLIEDETGFGEDISDAILLAESEVVTNERA